MTLISLTSATRSTRFAPVAISTWCGAPWFRAAGEREHIDEIGMGRTIMAPKSDAGTRVVALPRTVTREMRRHLGAHVAPSTNRRCSRVRLGRPVSGET
ncbi:MAG: hypothetical protein ABSD97_04670 [Acidimicrobiales bacterium]